MFINRCIFNELPIDFPVENDISFVHGPNGSGKTLLLRELEGYFKDQNQCVLYFPDERIFDLTEGEALRIMYKEKLSNPGNLFDKYEINIELLDIKTQEGKYIYSGYMQLVNLFCKVLKSPENTILIIDEPERNLHIGFKRTLIKDLMSLPNIKKLIVSTHSPEIPTDFKQWVKVEDCFMK